MELDALALTCRHLRTERDEAMAKLMRQKRAAHTMCHRLRKKLRKMELSNRLLIALYLATENHNRVIREQVTASTQELMEELPELGI